MFRRFCTILFFLLLVGGLLYWQVVRRGKEASAHPGQAAVPALDLRRSEALLKAANAFLDDDQDGMTLAKEAASKGDALRLAELLATQEKQRELFRQANQLLHERRFNELEEFLNQAEERGTASPRLLELRGVPQALQALALFCARRPYQNADDLRVSLDFLQPYLPVLSESPRFQQFYQEQKTLLADLERAGRHAKTLAILQDLDWCQATAGRAQQCLPLLKELAGTNADAFLLRLLGDVAHPQPSALFGESLSPTDGAEPLATDPLSQASLELAGALLWDELPEAQRKKFGEFLKKNEKCVTLTGTAMKAGFLNSTTLFETALEEWLKRASLQEAMETSPAFLPAYLAAKFPHLQTTEASTGVSPVPSADGMLELLHRFLR